MRLHFPEINSTAFVIYLHFICLRFTWNFRNQTQRINEKHATSFFYKTTIMEMPRIRYVVNIIDELF